MTSRCNRALLYSADEPSLLREICRVAIDEGGYRLAWVGFAEDDEKKSVRAVAGHGPAIGYLDGLVVSWAASESGIGPGHGPVGTAIREGRPVVGGNFATDALLKPWREGAKRAGFHSSIAVPLRISGRVAGALAIYADKPNSFTAEEVEVLTEMGEDLGYGITVLRLREVMARQHAENATLAQYLRVIQKMPTIMFRVDAQGVICESRGAGLARLGLADGDSVGKLATELLPRHVSMIAEALGGGSVRFETSSFEPTSQPTPKAPWAMDNLLEFDNVAGAGAIGLAFDVTDRLLGERALEITNARHRSLIDAMNDGLLQVAPEHNITFVNTRMCEMLGYAETEIIGKTPWDFGDEDAKRDSELRMKKRREGVSEIYERVWVRKDGSKITTLISAQPYTADGVFSGSVLVVTDITERLRLMSELSAKAEALERESRRMACLFQLSSLRARPEIRFNEVLQGVLAFLPSAWSDPSAVEIRIVYGDQLFGTTRERANWDIVAPIKERDRTVGRIELGAAPGREPRFDRDDHALAGEVARSLGIALTREVIEDQLRHLAQYDVVTGAPNRALFVETLRHEIARAKRDKAGLAVHFLDLDHFKDVNDTLGHPFGDSLLQSISLRLAKCVRESDMVARLGGDEFAVLQRDVEDSTNAAVLAQKLINEVAKPVQIEGHEIQTSTSVGIVIWNGADTDPAQLLQQADTALYQAKEEGRNTFRIHSAELDRTTRARVRLAEELRRGIDRGELVLHYQPQVDTADGRIVGVEALVRWNHPTRGELRPAAFIHLAESTGLIHPLGQFVLKEACRQAKEWIGTGVLPRSAVMAVNLSAVQTKVGRYEHEVERVLRDTGLDPANLEMELTESRMLAVTQQADNFIGRLRQLGVGFAIDDFGTGYSSLAYLSRLPANRLKIAGDFVVKMRNSAADAAIVRAVILIAREIGMRVIAEGVECEDDARFLRQHECGEMQGYLMAKPLAASALPAWAHSWRSGGGIAANLNL